MKIKELDIRDVGIIQGQKLSNLGQGIVVIGGHNRAGKTTFMKMLRHLGYGFNKGTSLAPPKFEYEVRGSFSTEDNENYDVILKGFSKPEVKDSTGKTNITIDEIYSNLDRFTYEQLFTISLDELGNLSNKDEYKMQSVLLGAGFSDIVKIPMLIDKLNKEADKIGGKRGTPSTKMFKPYNSNIRKGIELNKEALKQVRDFRNKKEELKDIECLINEGIENIDKAENHIIILDLLKNNYNLFSEMEELKLSIKDYDFDEGIKYKNAEVMGEELYKEYKEISKKYFLKETIFKNSISRDLNVKNELLKHKYKIEKFNTHLSGLREKIKNLFQLNEEINRKEFNLLNKMKSINENWDSLAEIHHLKSDEIDYGILINSVENYRNIIGERVEYEKSLETLELDKKVLEGEIKGYKSLSFSNYMKQYMLMAMILAAGGLGIYYFEKLLGTAFIIVGAIGVGLYLLIKFNTNALTANKCRESSIKLTQINRVINEKKEKLRNIVIEIEKVDEDFDLHREILKLDVNISPEGIKNYYEHLKTIKSDIIEFEANKNRIKVLYNEINIELKDFIELIQIFSNIISDEIDIRNPIRNYKNIFMVMENLLKYLNEAEELEIVEENKNNLEERIKTMFNLEFIPQDYLKTVREYISKGEEFKKHIELKRKKDLIKEKILQAFKNERVLSAVEKELNSHNKRYDSDSNDENYNNNSIEAAITDYVEDELILRVEELYKRYTSLNEIHENYKKYIKIKNEMKDKLDSSKEQCQLLKYEISELSTDKTLEEAHKLIHEGRTALKPLSEEYAVYNTASLILKGLQENFIKEAKDSLLKGAGEILNDITSGELKEIQPKEDLAKCDFKTVLHDGQVLEESKMLSRGTKEQLFLAVRINRIKEIKPALPVIFDDSFVNFDLKHTKKVVKLLNGLSKTNQIFVLTCHSQLIKLISEINDTAQYWKIEKGNFEETSSEKLKEYLNIYR